MTQRSDGLPDTWAEAANDADFPIFELIEPKPEYRWAGGYGWGDSPVGLEILHRVGDVEISVETNLREHCPPPNHQRRMLLFDLVFHAVGDGESPISLPMTWTASEKNLEIQVDGVPTVFDGIEMDDGRFAGTAQVAENLTLVLRVRGHGVTPRAIATCTNWAMPDMGPQLT